MNDNLFLAYIVDHKDQFLASESIKLLSETIDAISDGRELPTAFCEQFLAHFRAHCEPRIDALDSDFFSASAGDRRKQLSWSTESAINNVLAQFLAQATQREIQSFVSSIYTQCMGIGSTVQITTPKALDSAQKKQIREAYSQGVLFQVDQGIIGGMIAYANSTIVDKSFSSLMSRITQLTS